MKDIVEKVKELNNRRDRAVLATIVGVEGSAYRKEGAKMIFALSGMQFGTLSAGCLESDLALRAEGIMDSGKPDLVSYDMRGEEDLIWGLGSGCNGKIDILVEPLSWDWIPPFHESPVWPQIERLLSEGHHVAVARSIEGTIKRGATYLVTNQGNTIGTLGNSKADQLLESRLQLFLSDKAKKKTVTIEELATTFFFDRFEPKKKLYVFGAGPDAEPVVKSASKIDFDVIVVDHREARNTAELFPDAVRRIVAQPEQALDQLTIGPKDYAIIMTHSFLKDQTILSRLIRQPIQYLGVLGPKRRTKMLLGGEDLPDWIHSPIGIDLGADGPEEIAISIMAELLAIRNEKDVMIKK